MIKLIKNNLIVYCLTPFVILFSYWLIIGENFSFLLPQIINSALTGIILTLGIITICSWWFSLSRASPIINPIIVTLSLVFVTFFSNLIFSINYFKLSGLYTPLATHLNNTLESLTIILSLCFVTLVGVLISKEVEIVEEE